MKMRIKKWLVLFIAVLGMAFPAGVTAYAYTDEAAVQAAETEPPAEVVTETETPSETEAPLPEETPSETEVSPFSVSGNGQLLDDISGDDTKQFLTIQTKNGNTFFMVLDRSSNTENVYMLSMIDENDLAEFIGETKEPDTETPSLVLPETEPTPSIEETKDETVKDTEGVNTGVLLAIVLLIAGGICCYYYFKVLKPKKEEEDAEGEDLEFYDDGTYINEDEETDQENQSDEAEE